MRPGPADLRGPVRVGVRVDVVRGGEVLAVDLPVTEVSLDYQSSRDVPGKLEYAFPADLVPDSPYSPLNNYGQRSQVTSLVRVDGVDYEVPLGWFQHDSWDEDSGKLSALDLMQTLVENPMAFPSSPPDGATLLSELLRLTGGLGVVLDPGVSNGLVSRNTQFGTDRVANVQDLCAANNLLYGVKADGLLHVWPPSPVQPVAHFEAVDLGAPGVSGALIAAPRVSQDRRANRWTVVATLGDGDDAQTVSGSAESNVEPYDPSRYGVVTDRREMQIATSASQVQQAAQTYMANAQNVVESRSLEIPFDPRIEGGDVISAHTDKNETVVGRVTAYSMPVSEAGKTMRVDVEVLQW